MGYLGDGRLGLNFGRFGRFDPKSVGEREIKTYGRFGLKKMGEPSEKNLIDGRFDEKK